MKKVLLITLTFMLLFTVSSRTMLASSENSTSQCDCTSDNSSLTQEEIQAQIERDGGRIIELVTKSQVDSVRDIMLRESQILSDNSPLIDNEKYITLSENIVLFENVYFKGETNKNIASYALLLQDKEKQDDILVITGYVDLDKKDVHSFASIHFIGQESSILESKNINEEPIDYSMFAPGACEYVGVYLCTHHCTIWGFVNPIAGFICSLVCGITWLYVCS